MGNAGRASWFAFSAVASSGQSLAEVAKKERSAALKQAKGATGRRSSRRRSWRRRAATRFRSPASEEPSSGSGRGAADGGSERRSKLTAKEIRDLREEGPGSGKEQMRQAEQELSAKDDVYQCRPPNGTSRPGRRRLRRGRSPPRGAEARLKKVKSNRYHWELFFRRIRTPDRAFALWNRIKATSGSRSEGDHLFLGGEFERAPRVSKGLLRPLGHGPRAVAIDSHSFL
jgi:hypothetical protein